MASGVLKPLIGWQRANVLAATEYLREMLAREPSDNRARAVYDGLLEVLEPTRRAVRQQREMAQSAKTAVRIRELRTGRERRAGEERRKVKGVAPTGVERRAGSERRTGRDRRNR